MTIASATSRISYTGNGATVAFSVPFYFQSDSDLVVSLQDTAGTITVQTISTQYTLTGAATSSGGTCTFVTAPTTGYKVVIERIPTLTQTTSYNNNDPFPASSHEAALDKLTTIAQYLKAILARSIQVASTDESPTALPAAVTRANKTLVFDASGNPTVGVAPTTGTISSAIQPLTGAATTLLGRQALGVVESVFGTGGGTANAQTVTATTAADFALEAGLRVSFVPSISNTSAATLAINSGTAKSFRKKTAAGLTALTGGEIVIGTLAVADYDGTFWVLHDPAQVVSASSRLLGRTTAGAGAVEELTLGTGLSFVGSVLTPTKYPNYLSGLTLSTAGSSATFGIAAGGADDAGTGGMMILSSTLNKTTAAWAVGSGNGALDTGAIANNTWYHVYLIKRPDTGVVDALISLQASAGSITAPANYTMARRIGSMKTNGSGQWTSFTQVGDNFFWAASTPSNQAWTSTAAFMTVDVPLGIKVIVWLRISTPSTGGSNINLLVSSPDVTDNAPGSGFVSFVAGASAPGSGEFQVLTNTSQQVRIRASAAGLTDTHNTNGWTDTRGK